MARVNKLGNDATEVVRESSKASLVTMVRKRLAKRRARVFMVGPGVFRTTSSDIVNSKAAQKVVGFHVED